jgi:hypothetical protein
MKKIDPQNLAVDVSEKKSTGSSNSEPYVPNVPVSWVSKLYELPYVATKVGLPLWRAYRMQGSKKSFKFTSKYLEPFKLSRNQKYRGLNMLEGAGLIRIERQRGRAPIVTLLKIK